MGQTLQIRLCVSQYPLYHQFEKVNNRANPVKDTKIHQFS